MKRGTRIHEHLRQLDELSDHLAAISEAVSEVHKVAVLLRSVQDSYSTLVTALLARGDDELTLEFVKQALLDEEQRRGRPSDSGSSDMALKSACKFSTRNGNQVQALVLIVVNLDTLLEIVQNRNKSPLKDSIMPREQKNKRTPTLKKLRCLLLQWG